MVKEFGTLSGLKSKLAHKISGNKCLRKHWPVHGAKCCASSKKNRANIKELPL